MNQQLKDSKRAIRDFMQAFYTDERLVMLLAHARDGKLAFNSCCCFVGIPTATHALRGESPTPTFEDGEHYASMLQGGGFLRFYAEEGFLQLGFYGADGTGGDHVRRRRLIPIILAEMKRRERVRHEIAERELEESIF